MATLLAVGTGFLLADSTIDIALASAGDVIFQLISAVVGDMAFVAATLRLDANAVAAVADANADTLGDVTMVRLQIT